MATATIGSNLATVFGSTDAQYFGPTKGTIIWFGRKVISAGPGWSAKGPEFGVVVPGRMECTDGTTLQIPENAIPFDAFFPK